MKKLHFIFTALVLLTLSSCDKENSENFGRLAIYPLTAGAVITYADQTSDSITIVSSKNWKLSANSNWMGFGSTVDQKSMNGAATYDLNIGVRMLKNTTGAVRAASLTLDNGEHKVGRLYYQTYWLDVTHPQVTFTGASSAGNDDLAKYNGAHFDLNIDKDSVNEHLDFNIHAAQARLTTDAGWIAPKEVNVQSGSHRVALTFTKNTTGEDRKAVYTLTTSNGITTEIKVTQKGK